jgi:ribose-phosphate pyrophosphokinase
MRKKPNVVEEIKAIGEIEDKIIFIVDDMIDTAGTITLAAEMMQNEGAKSVRVVATHPILSGPAFKRIDEAPIDEVIVSNSIPLQHAHSDKIKILSIEDLFAEVIKKVYNYQSISSHFIT